MKTLDPKICFYGKFELIENGKKTPKYWMSRCVGYYPPMDALEGKDGKVSVYLMPKPAKSAEDAPSIKLQAKNSLNLTGLKSYFVDGGKVGAVCYGNPPDGETYGSKNPRPNPFKDNANDALLFLLGELNPFDFDGGVMEIPESFEMLIIEGGKQLAPVYCQALEKGGLDDELDKWRKQALSTDNQD